MLSAMGYNTRTVDETRCAGDQHRAHESMNIILNVEMAGEERKVGREESGSVETNGIESVDTKALCSDWTAPLEANQGNQIRQQ